MEKEKGLFRTQPVLSGQQNDDYVRGFLFVLLLPLFFCFVFFNSTLKCIKESFLDPETKCNERPG